MLLANINPFTVLANADSSVLREIDLYASIAPVDLGSGKPFKAWTYNGQVPGPDIRVTEGDTLRVTLRNNLPEGTTIHWHGAPVPHAGSHHNKWIRYGTEVFLGHGM